MHVTGFAPILPTRPCILILGSMPSMISLQRQEYYGNKHNAFWRILTTFAGTDTSLSYAQRVQLLQQLNIALWDVLKYCKREGSLDSSIKHSSEVANNIAQLLCAYPSIQKILLNGQKALTSFKRHILPTLSAAQKYSMVRIALPSTSPANARLSWVQKSNIWHQYLRSG